MNAIYARQSVDRADSISIESQIEFCQYEMRGEQYKVYTDRGYSGKILTEGTPKEVFSQVDLIKEHSLDVPQATEICYELQKAGVNIKELPLDEESCVDVLMEVLK